MAKTIVKKISTGYKPRPLQEVLHNEAKRFNILILHRRFGKTVWALNDMIHRGLQNTLVNPRYAYIAPLYGQAKRIAWDYLKLYTRNIPGAKANEAELRVDIPRPALGDTIRYSLYGADNPDALRGIYLDGVDLDEYAQMHPSVFGEIVRPALSDRKGWCTFLGTPRGMNHFYELYRKAADNLDWYTKIYRASETGIIAKEELEAAKMIMTDDEYSQEYECSFSAGVTGAYYTRQIEAAERVTPDQPTSRITNVPHQSDFLVDTYWDLGIGDSTVVWMVQQCGREYHVIDHAEYSGLDLPEIVSRLNKRSYNWGEHVLPHDAMARELGTGRTRVESLQTLGFRRVRVVKRQAVDDGIHAVRVVFSQCWFDKTKCAKGIDALKAYRRKYDEKLQTFSDAPLHDWASDHADAFRTFALGVKKEYSNINSLPRMAEADYNPFGAA